MNKEINIKVTSDEFKQLLKKHLIIKDQEKFVDILSGHICKDRYSMEQVFKAMLGIYSSLTYKKGDFVYVKIDNLASWRINPDLTLKLPGVIEGSYLPCKIDNIDDYVEQPYLVKYSGVKIGETEPCEQEYYIPEHYIYKKVENLEVVLDEIEDMIIKKDGEVD